MTSAWKEFLVDPAAFAESWADCRTLCDGIGWHAGRLVWELPADWRKRFGDALRNSKDPKKHLIEARFSQLMSLECPRRRQNGLVSPREPSSVPATPWTETVRVAQQRSECAAIIVPERHATDTTYSVDRLNESQGPWHQDRTFHVEKTRSALARLLHPLLARSEHVQLIDPYFDPTCDAAKRADLGTYFKLQGSGERRTFSLHLAASTSPASNDALVHNLRTTLIALQPRPSKIECFLWGKQGSRQHFHDRYLVSELGGLSLGSGFSSDSREGKTTLCSLLTPQAAADVRALFAPDSNELRLVERLAVT